MKYKIEDLLEKVVDNRGKTPPVSDNGHLLLEINCLTGDNKFPNYNVVQKIVSEEIYDTWFRSGHPQVGDILIPTVGTLDAIAFLNRNDCCIAQNIIAFRTNKEICDGQYLYYLLRDPIIRKRLLNLNIGGVQPSIKVPHLKQLKVDLPDLETQKKVVRILSSLDNKIELNNQQNQTLELILDKVFNENIIKNQEETWREYTLGELLDYEGGYSYTSKELVEKSDIGMMTIKNFERNGGFKIDGFKSIAPQKTKIKETNKFDIFVACTDVTQNADIIGNTVLLLNNNGYKKITYSMDLVKINPKELDKFILYMILKSKEFKGFALGYKSGTTVLHLNKNCLKEFRIKLPPEIELKNLSKLVKTSYEKIASNVEENQKLEKIRDTLLPKLMNGEINLNNVSID